MFWVENTLLKALDYSQALPQVLALVSDLLKVQAPHQKELKLYL